MACGMVTIYPGSLVALGDKVAFVLVVEFGR
jgi:hypothetical protein